MWLHKVSTEWAVSKSLCSERRDGDDFGRREVMKMAPMCYLDKNFFIVLCVGFLACAAQRIMTVFAWFSIINQPTLFLLN